MVMLGSNTYAYPRRGDGVHTDHQASIHTARSDAAKSTRQTMVDPWRMRCPEGHTSITPRQNGRYKCQSCAVTYADGPFDAAQHSFPIDADSWLSESVDDVFERFCEVANSDMRSTVICQDLVGLDGDGREVGRQLAKLHDQGLIEIAVARKRHHRWRLTEAGVAASAAQGSSTISSKAVVADD